MSTIPTMYKYGDEAWGWALIEISHPDKLQAATKDLTDLAIQQRYGKPWRVKRINVVEPIQAFQPKATVHLFVGVKAENRDVLLKALGEIDDFLRRRNYSVIQGFEVTLQPFSDNW